MNIISVLYSTEQEIREFGIDVPGWIDQDIDSSTVAAIIEGGCSSGAYMPAVTYWRALQTMNEYGDDVLQYIEERNGELPALPESPSWAWMACHYLSAAVELWADAVSEELAEAVQEAEDE